MHAFQALVSADGISEDANAGVELMLQIVVPSREHSKVSMNNGLCARASVQLPLAFSERIRERVILPWHVIVPQRRRE